MGLASLVNLQRYGCGGLDGGGGEVVDWVRGLIRGVPARNEVPSQCLTGLNIKPARSSPVDAIGDAIGHGCVVDELELPTGLTGNTAFEDSTHRGNREQLAEFRSGRVAWRGSRGPLGLGGARALGPSTTAENQHGSRERRPTNAACV